MNPAGELECDHATCWCHYGRRVDELFDTYPKSRTPEQIARGVYPVTRSERVRLHLAAAEMRKKFGWEVVSGG